MTTIHSQEDFLRALEENPQWKAAVRAQILGEELLQLPARFNAFVEEIRAFVEQMKTFVAEQRQVNAEQQQFNADQRQFNADQRQFNQDQRRINAQVRNDLATLKGMALESRVHHNMLNIAKDELNLTRGRVLRSPYQVIDPQLRAAIDQAETQGLITVGDADNLEVADVILRARRTTDLKYVYAVIELSFTVNQYDIDRAHDRANTLASVTGEETLAVVIGAAVHPAQQEAASQRGVRVVIPAMLLADVLQTE